MVIRFKHIIPELSPDEYKQLESNILKDGIREPLVVWGDTLIDGHNRYAIAQEYGLDYQTVNKDFYDDTEATEWIILNQFGRRNLSLFERARLALELKPIIAEKAKERQGERTDIVQKSAPSYGKTRDELAAIAGVSHDTISKVERIEKSASEEIRAKVKSGELSINQGYHEVKKEERKADNIARNEDRRNTALPANITLLQGDVLEQLDSIPNNSIDLLNTDPPYMIIGEEWDNFDTSESFDAFTEAWLRKAFDKLKSTGRAYISFSHEHQFRLFKILERNSFFGFNFGQVLIWNYRNNNKPSNRKLYRHAYEPIFYLFGKDAEPLNFTDDTYGETQTDVWEIATPQSNFSEGKEHPAQKPIELYRRIILTGSKENDNVLDCFAGSGTTGIVCKELKRNCILIERDKDYIGVIRGRINGME